MISSLIGSDTICAVATAPGMGGIAIIRVSGSEAVGIVDQIFSCREVRTLERAKDRMAYFGRFSHEGKTIDEGLLPPPAFNNSSLDGVLQVVKINNGLV